MPHTITAVYEHGVFVPQTPVNLPEHATVKVSLPGSSKKQARPRFQLLIAEPLATEQILVPTRAERHER